MNERMKRDIWEKIGESTLRITAALAVIFGLPAICYWFHQVHPKLFWHI